jgi:membrane protease YdiL (CAAX protease family)
VLVVGFSFGRKDLRQLLKKFITWRAPVFWYMAAIFLPFLISLLATVGSSLLGYALGNVSFPQPILLLPLSLLSALPFGPLGEELGWRGFLLPRLLIKYNWFVCSLIVGVVWTLWHLASFTYPGAAIASYFTVNMFTISLFFVEILLHAFIFTVFFLKTGGNLLVAILLHAAFNASSDMALSFFPSVAHNAAHLQAIYYLYLGVTGLALALLVFWNRRVLFAK